MCLPAWIIGIGINTTTAPMTMFSTKIWKLALKSTSPQISPTTLPKLPLAPMKIMCGIPKVKTSIMSVKK